MAYGWNVILVDDANDTEALAKAIQALPRLQRPAHLHRRQQPHRLRAPHKQDTKEAHGEPLGEEEIKLTKKSYGWTRDAKFFVPDGVYDHFKSRHRQARQADCARAGSSCVDDYKTKHPELADQL